jgi:hypothetical protein
MFKGRKKREFVTAGTQPGLFTIRETPDRVRPTMLKSSIAFTASLRRRMRKMIFSCRF